jgi:hypothetical protein
MSIYTYTMNENLSNIFGIESHLIPELSDQELTKKPEGSILCSGGGYVSEDFYKRKSDDMKKNNPMRDPAVVARMIATRTANGLNGRTSLSDSERAAISKRMRENNPTKNNPACTNTARPITVYYTDGNVEKYSYGKELTYVKGVPYSTIKGMIRYKKGSVKHNIEKINQG